MTKNVLHHGQSNYIISALLKYPSNNELM